MWLLLVLDMLFWGLIVAPLTVILWLPLQAIASVRPPSPNFALQVETPWDVLLHTYIIGHGLRIVDADGEHGLFLPGVAKLQGAFLMNHRSWGDFVVE